MKKSNNNLFTLEFLEPGEYIGRINSYNMATTTDGATKFLNIYIILESEDFEEEVEICKAYITNLGRNVRLKHFLEETGLLQRENQVDFNELIGIYVTFSIEYDENGKMNVSDLEEYIDFADTEDD